MSVPKYTTNQLVAADNKQDRFKMLNVSLDKQKEMPGPGQYDLVTPSTQEMSKESTKEVTKDLKSLGKHTVGAGNLGRIKKGQYPSFGTNQVREL